jgi:hypothetical protein
MHLISNGPFSKLINFCQKVFNSTATGNFSSPVALARDITIASEDAFFGEPELKFSAGAVATLTASTQLHRPVEVNK